MVIDQLDTAILGMLVVIVGSLITGFFTTRIHKLEDRIVRLEASARDDWTYIRRLLDFIYRNGLVPPDREEEN